MSYSQRFNDPIADQTQWHSIARVTEENAFLSHFIKKDKKGTIYIKKCILSFFFPLLIIAMGVVLMGLLLYAFVKTINDLIFGLIDLTTLFNQIYSSGSEILVPPIFLILSVVFVFVGIHSFRSHLVPVVFSVSKGYFYKGHLEEHEHPREKESISWCLLEEIVALQLLSTERHGEDMADLFEINIIQKNGTRINVEHNCNLKNLRKCACTLAQLLNVPLWDIVDDD